MTVCGNHPVVDKKSTHLLTTCDAHLTFNLSTTSLPQHGRPSHTSVSLSASTSSSYSTSTRTHYPHKHTLPQSGHCELCLLSPFPASTSSPQVNKLQVSSRTFSTSMPQ